MLHYLLFWLVRASELKDASHIDELTDESVLILEVVDVVVLKLEERSCLRLLINDDWEDGAGIQLGGGIEIDLAQQGAQASHRPAIPLHLLSEADDLGRVRKVRKGLKYLLAAGFDEERNRWEEHHWPRSSRKYRSYALTPRRRARSDTCKAQDYPRV